LETNIIMKQLRTAFESLEISNSPIAVNLQSGQSSLFTVLVCKLGLIDRF